MSVQWEAVMCKEQILHFSPLVQMWSLIMYRCMLWLNIHTGQKKKKKNPSHKPRGSKVIYSYHGLHLQINTSLRVGLLTMKFEVITPQHEQTAMTYSCECPLPQNEKDDHILNSEWNYKRTIEKRSPTSWPHLLLVLALVQPSIHRSLTINMC